MMELVKKHIHMNRRRGNVTSQITLDDDFNVPDSMDDVEELILDSGEIQIESAKNLGEKVAVRGKLNFRVLYRKPDGGLMTLAGTLPFEENVNVPGLKEQDFLQAGWELDDLNIGLINSRKLSVKALVTLKIQAETLYDAEHRHAALAGSPPAGREHEAVRRENPYRRGVNGIRHLRRRRRPGPDSVLRGDHPVFRRSGVRGVRGGDDPVYHRAAHT